jgi:hypothetical protein
MSAYFGRPSRPNSQAEFGRFTHQILTFRPNSESEPLGC